MNFDIKDVKSWANRDDVHTLSDVGFFGNSLSEIDDEIKRYNNGEKDRLHELYQVSDNGCYCFGYAVFFADTGAFSGTNNFAFFLPLDAVKKDKPEKKYRPIKNMAELADIMYGEDRHRGIISTGDLMTLERKKDRFRFRILITQLEYENDLKLVSINDKTLKNLFDDYKVMNVNGIFVPFGVEVKND